MGNIYISTKEIFSPKRQPFEKSCTKNFFELSEEFGHGGSELTNIDAQYQS